MNQQSGRIKTVVTQLKDFWIRYARNKAAVLGLLVVLFFFLIAILAPVISPYDPHGIGADTLQPPSLSHMMGTDDLGRDVYSQVLHGARISLFVGFSASFVSTLVGVLIGSISGFFGGLTDDLLMRIAEIFQIIPRFFLSLLLVVLFGPNLLNIVIAIGILSWPVVARLTRAEFLSLKESQFVEAAKSIGESTFRIIFSEILVNALPPIIVVASLEVAHAILLEAGLGFLGLSDPSMFSWGRTLDNSRIFLRDAWWMGVFPGLSISLLVLSLNLVGDGLGDVLNPKLKER